MEPAIKIENDTPRGPQVIFHNMPEVHEPALIPNLEKQLEGLGIAGLFKFRFRCGNIHLRRSTKETKNVTWTLLKPGKRMPLHGIYFG